MSKTPNVSQQRRKKQLMMLAGAVIVAGAVAGGYWFFYGSHFVATDNAYAAVEITQVTPSIGGTVSEVLVKDTQTVKKGDLLLRIDPTDAQLVKAQADAELENTLRRVRGYFATDSNLHSQIQAREADELRAAAQLAVAQANFARASVDLKRRKALVTTVWDNRITYNHAELVGIVDSDNSVREMLSHSGMPPDAVNQAIDGMIIGQSSMLATNQMMVGIGVAFVIAASVIWLAPRPSRVVEAGAGGH